MMVNELWYLWFGEGGLIDEREVKLLILVMD